MSAETPLRSRISDLLKLAPPLRWLLPSLIFLWGLVYCLTVGRLGIHPLDSSIVFDGAIRLLRGEDFFLDFQSPNGYVPAWLQAGLFRLMGVSWFSYCLHAALINGLFGVLSYALLRLLGAPRWHAGLYAAASCLLLYPPMGVPFMDQHSFFFGLLAIYLGMRARRQPGLQPWLDAGMVLAMALAVLSKQIPGGFAVLAALALRLGGLRLRDIQPLWRGFAYGALAVLLLLVLLFPVFRMDWSAAWEQFYTLPSQTGQERWAQLSHQPLKILRTVLFLPYQMLWKPLAFLPWLVQLPLYLWGISHVLRLAGRPWFQVPLLALRTWGMSLLLSVISSLQMLLSLNQPENGLAFGALGAGLLHLSFVQMAQAWWPTASDGPRRWYPQVLAALPALIFMGGWWTFHTEVNVQRKVIDLGLEMNQQAPAPAWPEGYGGMDFMEYAAYGYAGQTDPALLLATVREEGAPFLLWGDMTFVYGFAGQENPWPSMWLHPGLTMPLPFDPEWQAYETSLLERLRAKQVRQIWFEYPDHTTYMDVRWADFPHLAALVDSMELRVRRIGGYEVWDLSPGFGVGDPSVE